MNIKARYLTIIAIGMLMAMSPTSSEEGPFILAGVGAMSCGKVIADTEDDKTLRNTYFFWAQGFLSGLNHKYELNWESSTDLSDPNALRLWIENYCEDNPLDSYALATKKLWYVLRARQGLDPDPVINPKE